MAKGNSGGKRANGLTASQYVSMTASMLGITPQQVMNSADYQNKYGNQQVQQQQAPQSMSASFNQFMSMSDDDKADVIGNMVKQGVPAHLADNSFQRFIYNIGLNDKPDVVSDATLDSMSGKELFRTVNHVKNTSVGVTYTAPQIAKQIQGGKITRSSDTGGSAVGRGLYFADDCSHSMKYYGNTTNDINKTATIRGKLNSNAKIISLTNASNGVYAEIKSGSKLGKALAKCDIDSRVSIYALAKGYNVITGHSGYHNILNRQAITLSKDVHAKNNKLSWK